MVIVAKAQEVDTQSSAATLRKSALMSEKGKGIGFIVAAVLFIRDSNLSDLILSMTQINRYWRMVAPRTKDQIQNGNASKM